MVRSTLSQQNICLSILSLALVFYATGARAEKDFAGIVSSATPEATAAGIEVLEKGGNAIDAAVAVSLALGATEPAGSGLFGQTVMLVRLNSGEEPFVIQGTTYSPGTIPAEVDRSQLTGGHTASTVPSTLRVLDFANEPSAARRLTGPIRWRRQFATQVKASLLAPFGIGHFAIAPPV